MRILNIAVVVMGVMIVVGLAVIGVTIAKRLGGASEPAPALALPLVPGGGQGTPLAAFDPATVPLPAGSRLQQIVPAGDRLVLHMAGEGGKDVLMVLDMAGGRVLGSFLLEPAQ